MTETVLSYVMMKGQSASIKIIPLVITAWKNNVQFSWWQLVMTISLIAHEDSTKHGFWNNFSPQGCPASILAPSQFLALPRTIVPPHRLKIPGLSKRPMLPPLPPRPPLPLLLRDWTILPCYAICCSPIHMSCHCWKNVTRPWLRPCWAVTSVSTDDYREQMTALVIVVSECCILCDCDIFHFVFLRALYKSAAGAAARSS